MPSFVLIGLESTGKSTLFNILTESGDSEELNFRGSTVVCREGSVRDAGYTLIDTPGIRVQSDSETTRLALEKLQQHDSILLVLRATHAREEWLALRPLIADAAHRIVILLTFADKIISGLDNVSTYISGISGLPVLAINAREAGKHGRLQIITLLRQNVKAPATAFNTQNSPMVNIQTQAPQQTLFEHPQAGKLAAMVCLFLLFALPVWGAWILSDFLQPVADLLFIHPMQNLATDWDPFIKSVFVGNYGLFSLGINSFIWAFPVVLLLGISLSVTEDSGLKERITTSLDPWLRKIGLNGRDLIPVLSGFGCNVVAVFQSRSCSRCTRNRCISMITFGSACSYQTGATLSVFNATHHGWLFIPYLGLLFITAAIHTRIWNKTELSVDDQNLTEPGWLQWPRWRNIRWRLNNVLRQFLGQAMPIFLIICCVASLLDYTGVIRWISRSAGPVLKIFNLPSELMPGIIFSLLRKDGLMVLNQDGGNLLRSLSSSQVLLLVWLSSTLMACLVTVLTMIREINWQSALSIVGRQALSSLLIAFILAKIFIH